ncbi:MULTISPECIES: lipopolysaccharide assembly protein LapB [unclassified Borrelia]|uniref:tetratricopeptide repeat protein n=1 Tax=unclassified Borrelia TaxID=2649934 RepID=UPI001E499717|nr:MULTISPECIES: tetratricopeptide repeat protein [unclassified Borrelia]UGQ15837.1 tetratricopeptide repeat protein [Borrelia sp. RT5S]UGQ16947.1 tetratricopeptide repeat protein [Borrelia sp. RT1S]
MSSEKITELTKEIYLSFRKGDFKAALIKSEEAHSLDFDNVEILTALKSSVYWNGQVESLDRIGKEYERAEFLIREWNNFARRYLKKMDFDFIQGRNSIKHFVFQLCLEIYKNIYKLQPENLDVLTKIAKSYKGMGNYEKAITVFLQILGDAKENSDVLAELADSYALIDEIKEAKVLFREAFFINPQKIDIDALESEMILKLIETIKCERNVSDTLIKEWIPVYGTLNGVFNIKRELRPIELGHLKQSVYSLRNELRAKSYRSINESILLPRLINKYFWLIDHYVRIKEDRVRIDEILSYIKEIDIGIYQQYVN